MAVEIKYLSDYEEILSKQYDNGADLWTTPDKKLMKGSPFTTLNSPLLLLELGVEPDEPILKDVAALIFSAWKEDGRFKVYPKGTIYPCQTIHAADTLCRLGYANDERLQKTFRHLLEIQHTDGGWRCEKYFFGKGPETDFSNPGPTLTALDVFRHTDYLNTEPALDKAVDFLLEHWTIRMPIGPCHYGIGTLFMQAEYPFGDYNIFSYVYILSFYNRAKEDKRFLEAFDMLQSKTKDGQLIVERVNHKLANLSFCKKGEPSELGTKRYHEILKNLGK